jgi:hypothetical protein
LFCFWDDVFWPDDPKLRAEFSESEWAAPLRACLKSRES